MAEARTRYELFGKVSSGADVWSCGFYGASNAGNSAAQILANAEGVYDEFVDKIWSDTVVGEYWADETTLEGCRLRDIDATNVTTRVATFIAATPVPGGASGTQLPAEVSIVCSLYSGVAGGRGRGRMYLPATTTDTVYQDGVLGSTEQVALINGLHDFVVALNAMPSNEFPGVFSMYSGVAGVLRPIIEIRVGNVFDSQRRRRNTQLEHYETLGI